MNRLFVLKDVAYAAKQGGGVIASVEEVDLLVPGALAFFTDKGVLLTALNAAATIPDVKFIQIASGRAGDTQFVPVVPRKGILDVNLVNYRASTKMVVTVGGTTAQTSLSFENEGQADITVSDVSYTSRYAIRSVRASVYKKAYQTEEQLVDELVLKLNAGNSFITATKVGSAPNFGITITPKEDDVAISVSLDGMFEGDRNEVTTAAVHSIGKGVDIAKMEKDFSVEDGNGNYIDYTQEHFSVPLETVPSTNYNVVSLSFMGTHDTPTNSKTVMRNTVSIACVVGAAAGGTNQSAANIVAMLALIIGNAYSPTTGAEPVLDDGTEIDGVAGN